MAICDATHRCKLAESLAQILLSVRIMARHLLGFAPSRFVIRLPMQRSARFQGAYIRLCISRERLLSHHRSLSPPIYECGGEQGSPRLPPHEVLFAEICGQHIKELHIRRWLSQRPASDLIQQGMIRLTPACPHQRPQIAFHAAAGGFKMLSGLLVEALGDQQNMVGLLLHLFQHIDGVVKAGQLSRYAQQTKKAIRIQRNIQIPLRDITYQRHNNWSFISGPLI